MKKATEHIKRTKDLKELEEIHSSFEGIDVKMFLLQEIHKLREQVEFFRRWTQK